MAENYISCDVEAGGPYPPMNLASVGACEIENPENNFYIELKPDTPMYIPEAYAVGGFTYEGLMETGIDPQIAIEQFGAWLEQFKRPIMVAFPIAFDWQFINYYFCRFYRLDQPTKKRNPFGISGIDGRSFYMGSTGKRWGKTVKSELPKHLLSQHQHTHNALEDAKEQAEIFKHMLDETRERNGK